MGLLVNLEEFAGFCSVSVVTMRSHINAVEGNPGWLVERGERGRGYQIEVEGGVAWWRSKRDADDQASAERQAQLQQLRFDLVGEAAGGSDALALSGKQRREEHEAELVRIKLRQTMGQLIEKAALEGPAVTAVIELRRQLMLVPAEFGVETGASPADVQALFRMLERAVNTFVSKLPSAMKPDA